MTSRIRWIASAVGAYSSICALGTTLLAVAVLLIVSLIPLFLNKHGDDALGELYCINNYSLIVGFEIPQYNTTFKATINTGTTYNFTAFGNASIGQLRPRTLGVNTTEHIATSDTCIFYVLSIVYPRTPNGKVLDNYALSETCYRTLQTCYYDPLLTSCLLSDCVAVEVVDSTINASYPLTNYRLRCAAKIYYKTRCLDSPASYHLYYSSSQPNSACRQQRLNRINTCLNSTVQLLNVPCLISVSSGRVTYRTATCTQSVSVENLTLSCTSINCSGTLFQSAPSTQTVAVIPTFSSEEFSASDQDDGHVYRISSVHSEYYNSTQPGALYCGGVTLTQIASSITAAIYSQT